MAFQRFGIFSSTISIFVQSDSGTVVPLRVQRSSFPPPSATSFPRSSPLFLSHLEHPPNAPAHDPRANSISATIEWSGRGNEEMERCAVIFTSLDRDFGIFGRSHWLRPTEKCPLSSLCDPDASSRSRRSGSGHWRACRVTQRSYLQVGFCFFSPSVSGSGGTAGAGGFSFYLFLGRRFWCWSGEAVWMVTSGGSSAKLVPEHM